MGYNLFNIKEVSGAFNKKLDNFRASLGDAISKGTNIPFADSDVSYVLKLQNDRLSRKRVDIDYSIYNRDENNRKYIVASDWQDAHYHSSVCFQLLRSEEDCEAGRKDIISRRQKICSLWHDH